MPNGVRWAETTRTSCGTSNSASASAAADITVQSESLPIITPTSAASGMRVSVREVLRRSHGPGPHVVQVIAQRRHVADLATGPEPLAVQVNLDVWPVRHAVVYPFVDALGHHVVRAGQ